MKYFSEIFWRHSLDIGSLVFTLVGWAYILTFEFWCAGLNFETSDLVTFWLSGGQLLRPSGLVSSRFNYVFKYVHIWFKYQSLMIEGCLPLHHYFKSKIMVKGVNYFFIQLFLAWWAKYFLTFGTAPCYVKLFSL